MSMNKTLRIVFKVLGIGIAALAVIVIALIIIAVICVPPAPSASNSQLEKACGIAFPSYTIIDKATSIAKAINETIPAIINSFFLFI